MGCSASAENALTTVTDSDEAAGVADQEKPVLKRSISFHGSLLAIERLSSQVTPQSSTDFGFIQSQLSSALKLDWAQFDWTRDCNPIHEGSMKVVGRLISHPSLALASMKSGQGDTIEREVNSLSTLQQNGIRTVMFSSQLVDVPHFDKDIKMTCKGYLFQYFSEDSIFLYEEGEPGTEDHYLEPMHKLRIMRNDEGDWTMNRHVISVLKNNGLEDEFMEDLSAYVKFMLAEGLRIIDLQGLLGRDGHFFMADPLDIQPIGAKVNRDFLAGVFMKSINPKRENKPYQLAFVDSLGVELGIDVPDEM